MLDIDGVLNNKFSKSRCGEYVGIDSDKVRKLKKIVDATGAEIVLTSTWRLGQNREHNELHNHIKYMRNKLGKEKLHWISSVPDLGWCKRGAEIREWFAKNNDINIEGYVILDDEVFSDYDDELLSHLVQTEFYSPDGGLQDEDVDLAIKILNENINVSQ